MPPPSTTQSSVRLADSRRTGAAWAGLCGVGHVMDFGVGALILMGVIMIGPPKSEKLKAPHRGDATAAGKRTGSRCGGQPSGAWLVCAPDSIPPGIRVPGNGAPIPPDMAAVVHAWDQAQAPAGAGAQPRSP